MGLGARRPRGSRAANEPVAHAASLVGSDGEPTAFVAAALLVAAVSGTLPSWDDVDRYSGLPTLGVAAVSALVILGALGEETGWRGFALPLLQRRYSPLAAALLVTPIWAAWHLPFFFTISTYRDFAPPAYIGFVFALGCGSIVLTWLYNRTGGSILACAIWHGLFNMSTATVAASGMLAGVTSALVIVQAVLLLRLELRARKRGGASVIGPHLGGTHPRQAAIADVAHRFLTPTEKESR